MRRKRHSTGNSPIHFLLFALALPAALIALACSPHAARAAVERARPAPPSPSAQIEAVADDFEGLMMNHLYKQMSGQKWVQPGDDSNPFAPSQAEMIYRGMMEDQMMNNLAKQRPLGFGKMVAQQLRGQGGIRAAPPPGRRAWVTGPTTSQTTSQTTSPTNSNEKNLTPAGASPPRFERAVATATLVE